jgi:hypothetical protein
MTERGIDTTMTEADFSGKKLGLTGAQILAAFMSTKLFEAKGALVSLNLAKNYLGAQGANQAHRRGPPEMVKLRRLRSSSFSHQILCIIFRNICWTSGTAGCCPLSISRTISSLGNTGTI